MGLDAVTGAVITMIAAVEAAKPGGVAVVRKAVEDELVAWALA